MEKKTYEGFSHIDIGVSVPCHMRVERVLAPSPDAPTKHQLMYHLSLVENNKTTSNRQMNKYSLSVGTRVGTCVDIAGSARAACIVLLWLLVQSC